MKLWILTFTLILVGGISGCGIDDTLKSPPAETVTPYTVLVNIQPPVSLRTEETWTRWTLPVQAAFRTTFESVEDDHGAEESDTDEHADEGPTVPSAVIGQTTLEGFNITVKSEGTQELWQMGHDGLEEMPHADGATHHIEVMVQDALSGHEAHGHINVPEAQVHLEVEVNGEEKEIELHPVQGDHGLRYEANTTVPLGVYHVKANVSPPSFYRMESARRWAHTIEGEIPAYDFSSGSAEHTIESDGMRITVRSGAPKIYGALGMGQLPHSGEETVNFSVQLEDLSISAEEGETIPLRGVNIIVINEETGASLTQSLLPIYGEHGFHYGANIGLPHEGTLQNITTETANDGHSDGDDH